MATHSGLNIPTDSLVLCVDAGNTTSYSGSGTTWSNVNRRLPAGDLTLYNSPQHTSGKNGYFYFNDSNDSYAASTGNGNTAVLPDTGAFSCGFIYMKPNTGGRGGIFNRNTGSPYNGFSFGQGGTLSWRANVYYDATTAASTGVDMTYPTTNTWYFDMMTYNGTDTVKTYRNGIYDNTATATSSIGNLSDNGTRQQFTLARRSTSTDDMKLNIAAVFAYHKELSADEIEQLFKAYRGRYDF